MEVKVIKNFDNFFEELDNIINGRKSKAMESVVKDIIKIGNISLNDIESKEDYLDAVKDCIGCIDLFDSKELKEIDKETLSNLHVAVSIMGNNVHNIMEEIMNKLRKEIETRKDNTPDYEKLTKAELIKLLKEKE